MRNVRLGEFDDLPLDVLPIGTDYPPDHLLACHEHRRAQLLYGASGVMLVETDDGSWTVPNARAVLIPPGVAHQVHFIDVTTWSLYIESHAVPWWPSSCTVVEVAPLLRELLRAADALDVPYDITSRDGALLRLILHELQRVSPIALHVTLPPHGPFRELCRAYLAAPQVSTTNADWGRATAMSQRTLDRKFREAAGTSPASWRARARLLASLPMLRRSSVTEVASQLGYSSPAAFTAAFTRAFGAPPSHFSR